jgi:hypothetical protein
MDKVYTGRKEIVEGIVELFDQGLMHEQMSDILVVLEDDLQDKDTMQITDDGVITLRTRGLSIGTF